MELVPHDPGWPRAFREEHARLADALPGSCGIEYVGSTAVHGLCAKPILDIAIGVAQPGEVDLVVAVLARLGYIDRGDAGTQGGRVLVREREPLVRTHHVHVVCRDGAAWHDYLSLRDHLRRDPAARDAYGAAKSELARRYSDDRRGYTKAKSEIIWRLLAEARASGSRPRPGLPRASTPGA